MFDKILVANRGEVACRVIRACRELGIKTVAVYSSVEAHSLHVELADEPYPLGDTGRPSEGYLDVAALVGLARRSHADAIHPGYGFLSENPEFARACRNAGIVFVGPPAEVMEAMANKREARAAIARLGIQVLPGTTAPFDGATDVASHARANTRLQVEHGITEMAVGLDIVKQQISVASGAPLEHSQAEIAPYGHAIECRIYAEDPQTFLPSPGTLAIWQMPQGDGVRVDTGLRQGDEVTPHFDPLLAKVMGWAKSRPEAISKVTEALQQTRIEGVRTNIPFLLKALASPQFTSGQYTTSLADMLTASAT